MQYLLPYGLWSVLSVARCCAGSLEARAIQPHDGDICYLNLHRSAIAGDNLYFMGGQHTVQGGVTTAAEQKLYALDLTSSFVVDSCILGSNLKQIDAPADSNWNGTGVFFLDANETLLYTFGGFHENGPRTDALPLYSTTSESWDIITVPGEPLNWGNRDGSMFASSLGSSQDLSFIQGGHPTDTGRYLPYSTSGLITFDASNPSNLSWFNSTESSNTPHTLGASMQYVRLGRSGTLIGLGGYAASGELVELDQIMVYDVESMKWHKVTAGGAIPDPRDQFCTVVSPAADDSSFNIVMYGGRELVGNITYEDVYILSLPSFQWINVTHVVSSHSSGFANAAGRHSHTCSIYRNRYMIVLGGVVGPGNSSLNSNSCNCSYPVIRVFDTSNLTWLQHWSNTPKPYTVPASIYNFIGGGEWGGAVLRQPSGGFNESLASVFSISVPRYVADSLRSPSYRGAIIGLSSGLAALVLFLAAIMFCIRHAQKRNAEQQSGTHTIPSERVYPPHHARANDYHELSDNERRCELMEHEVNEDGAFMYEMSGELGNRTTHELNTGRRRWSML